MHDETAEGVKPLSPSLLSHCEAEFKRRHYFIAAPAGVSVEDVEKPQFWKHASVKFQESDLLEIVSDSGDFDGTWRVVSVGPGFCVVRRLTLWVKAEEAPAVTGEGLARVEFLPTEGWAAFDEAGARLGVFETMEAAEEALRAYLDEEKAA